MDDGLLKGEIKTFRISSLQDALDFALCINNFGQREIPRYDVSEEIRNAYEYSLVHTDDDRVNGRFFNAYIDLELTYLFAIKDAGIAARTHNQLHNSGKVNSRSIFADLELSSGKLDVLYALSALSFRVRAFWDKFMGLLFLLYDYENYENFIGANSKRRFFVNNAGKWCDVSRHFKKSLTNILRTLLVHAKQQAAVKMIDDHDLMVPFPDPFLQIVGELISMVDQIRTQEAHGPGILRKWALVNLPVDQSPDFALINHLNIVNEFMHALRRTVDDLSKRQD